MSGPLTAHVVAAGAPAHFGYHAVRHTIATFLENEGNSVWERGLVLNHSDGGVTAGYSHGFAHDLKLMLLTKWSDHIERLVQSERRGPCALKTGGVPPPREDGRIQGTVVR